MWLWGSRWCLIGSRQGCRCRRALRHRCLQGCYRVDGTKLRLFHRRSRILGDVDSATAVAEGHLVYPCKTFAFGLDGECASHVQALQVCAGVVMLGVEGAYTSERLLEQGVIGVAWIGQVAGSSVLQQGRLHGLLGQGAGLAVHGEAMVLLEVFHG